MTTRTPNANSSATTDAAREVSDVSHKKRIRMAIDPDEMTEPTFEVEYPHDARKLDIIQKNPLVPAGALVTAGVLGAGLLAFQNGSQRWSQALMRGRVLAQGATLAVLMYSVWDKAKVAVSTGDNCSTNSGGSIEPSGIGSGVPTHGSETS